MSKPKPDDDPLAPLPVEPGPQVDPSVLGHPYVATYEEFLAVSRAALTPADQETFTVAQRVELECERAILRGLILTSSDVLQIYTALVLMCWPGWLDGRWPRLRAIADFLDPQPRFGH
jgi:hypothetical protein